MKILIANALGLAAILICVFGSAIPACSQDKKWIRVYFEEGVSIALPEGFLIDKEKNSFKRKCRIIYDQVDARIDVYLSEAKEYTRTMVKNMSPASGSSDSAEIDGTIARKLALSEEKGHVSIAGQKYYYSLNVKTTESGKDTGRRFFDSLMINGKPVFKPELGAPPVSLSLKEPELGSSPEIIEAYRPRPGARSRNIEKINSEKEMKPFIFRGMGFERNAITLSGLDPKTLKDIFTGETRQKDSRLIVFVEFEASGEIGNIRYFSSFGRKTTKAALDYLQQTVFVPASSEGKPAGQVFHFVYIVDFLNEGEVVNEKRYASE